MGLAEKQLAEEVLHSIKNGGFPDSEEVASAQLDAPSFNTLIDVLSVERENAKVCSALQAFSKVLQLTLASGRDKVAQSRVGA